MSDVELTIRLVRKIESALKQRGATGKGLRDKVSCFAPHFSQKTHQAIRAIGRERNRIAHDEVDTLSDREAFVQNCEEVLQAIADIPPGAVALEPDVEPRFRIPVRPRFGGPAPSVDLATLGLKLGRGAIHVFVAKVVFGIFAAMFAVILAVFVAWAIGHSDDTRTTQSAPKPRDLIDSPRDTTRSEGAASDVNFAPPKAAPTAPSRDLRAPKRVKVNTESPSPKDEAPPPLEDSLPALEVTDPSGQRRVVGADLGLGKLAPSPSAAPTVASPKSKPANRGSVDLHSRDLESF